MGSRLLKHVEVLNAVNEEKARIVSNGDAIVSANIKYWLSLRDDEEAPHGARLKASEYLGKYGAMFTEKIEVSGDAEKPLMVSISEIMK